MSNAKHVFKRITTFDSENVDYELDGVHLINANHDDHGWSGMADIQNLLKAIAERIGAEWVEDEATEEEDD